MRSSTDATAGAGSASKAAAVMVAVRMADSR
jgi:hypothetical protein